jgi:hypothetical protein
LAGLKLYTNGVFAYRTLRQNGQALFNAANVMAHSQSHASHPSHIMEVAVAGANLLKPIVPAPVVPVVKMFELARK